jgi:hypothetical protein
LIGFETSSIKVAIADGKFNSEEQETLQKFLRISQLKISRAFLANVRIERYSDIVSGFENKSNLDCAYSIAKKYASMHGVHPDFEGKVLDEIKSAVEGRKKQIKFSIKLSIKRLFYAFSFLWGKEEISPGTKTVLAIVFTIVACIFGSIWTSDTLSLGNFKYGGLGALIGGFFEKKTTFVTLTGSASIIGLLMFGALSFRNYLPLPKNFRGIIFSIANLYLMSIIAMHIIGRSGIGKGIIFTILFGIILLLWLGMKEILGFMFIGIFILLIYKIFQIDQHLDWRAFPFIASAFMGLSFQSNNFFNDFKNLSGSFFKKPQIDNNLVTESLQLPENRVGKITKSTVAMGATAAGAAELPGAK